MFEITDEYVNTLREHLIGNDVQPFMVKWKNLLNTVANDVIESYDKEHNPNPNISFITGNTRFSIGRFILVLHFDNNDEFKMIYIYENTECVAAFNDFKSGILFVFSSLLDE